MIRVGTAGWSYPDWAGIVYPRRKPRFFHPLSFLARFFDCVEINASFYAIPRAKSAREWAERVGDRPDFRFSVKLYQGFTHSDEDPEGPLWEEWAEAFRAALAPLSEAGRLTAVLVQYPHSFRRQSGAERRLERLAELLEGLPRVLELRHASWFGAEPLARIADWGYSLAALDLPRAADHPPEDFEPTGPLGSFRLHGRNRGAWFDRKAGRDQRYDYLYGPQEVEKLLDRARRLSRRTDETYVVTNNHFEGKAAVNALELRSALSAGPVLAPPDLVRAYPRLAPIVRPEGQLDLF